VRAILSGRFDRPVERSVRLLAGLVLFGLAMALLLEARAGLDPWNVFHQGVTRHVDLTIGQVTVISSLVLLALWVPLRQRPGLGTIANAIVVGPVLDLGVAWFPTAHGALEQGVFMVVAILATAVATGLYVGAGWGPGPRDGLMTGLAARGIPLGAARAGIELSVLVAGWLLGGSVGVGTVAFALAIGPLVHRAMPWLAVSEAPAADRRPVRPPCPPPRGRAEHDGAVR
jgi:uncharacterized membrane protein YczE